MLKTLAVACFISACFVKLSVTSFKEQLEFPGIQSGTTLANYTIEIENPKEEEIEVDGIWVRGRWIKFKPKSYSGNPITIRASVKHINSDTLSTKVTSPTKNKEDKGAIKYHLKGKSKSRFIGIGDITKEPPIARP